MTIEELMGQRIDDFFFNQSIKQKLQEQHDDFNQLIFGKPEIISEIEKIARLQREHTEKTLADIISKYDFMVGSMECKYKLLEVLPDGAKVICTPYITSPTTIYAIKKFDIMDLLAESQEKKEEAKQRTAILNDVNEVLRKYGLVIGMYNFEGEGGFIELYLDKVIGK